MKLRIPNHKKHNDLIWLLSYISIASVSVAIVTHPLPAIQSQYALNLGTIEWIAKTSSGFN